MSLALSPRHAVLARLSEQGGTAATHASDHAPELPTVQEVFEEHGAFVVRMVRRLGVRPGDVEDVAQEVFVIVHRKLDTFDGRNVRAWLVAIVQRVASDYRRLAHIRRERPGQASHDGIEEPAQEQQLARQRMRLLLDDALDTIDDDKRIVFILYELEGTSIRDIAATLGCPLQTAYSRLHAARALVKEHIERALGEGGRP